MKLFDAIGDFLKTLFVPPEVTEKKKKPGAQTHGGFSDGFQKAPNAKVNLTGMAPALIVVPEEKPEPPQPDNEFLASVDDLPLDVAANEVTSEPIAPALESPVATIVAPTEQSSQLAAREMSTASSSESALTETPSASPSDASHEFASSASTSEQSTELASNEAVSESVWDEPPSASVGAPSAQVNELASGETPSETSIQFMSSASPSEQSTELESSEPPDNSTRELIEMMNSLVSIDSLSSETHVASADESTRELIEMVNELSTDAAPEVPSEKQNEPVPSSEVPNEPA